MIQPPCAKSILPFWQSIVMSAFTVRLAKVKCAVFVICNLVKKLSKLL